MTNESIERLMADLIESQAEINKKIFNYYRDQNFEMLRRYVDLMHSALLQLQATK